MEFYENTNKYMKLYEIKNEDYETKCVAAINMREALGKYEKYLERHLNGDYSYIEILGKVTTCTCIGEYQQPDVIV